MCIGGEETFLIRRDSAHFFNWEQYGLRITVLEGSLSPTDTCEVAVRALVGGQFQLPEDTELISAVYSISVSKPLLKPIILEIQHCADLVTQDHTSYLSFATASVNTGLPYKFYLVEGGQFYPGSLYGSIFLSWFSLWAIIKCMKRLVGYPTSSQQHPYSSSLPSEQSQTKGRLIVLRLLINVLIGVSKPLIDNKYVAQIIYEVKHHSTKWLMHFVVAKHLNALLEVSKTLLELCNIIEYMYSI